MRRVAVVFALVFLLAPGGVPAAATSVPTCNTLPATIFGKSGTITGTNGNDVIVGSPGPDTIRAGDGDDVVCGGGDDDRIEGGNGADFLVGEAGADAVWGGDGNDAVIGELDPIGACLDAAADRLDGGRGDDALLDGCGANRATGGPGHDLGTVTGSFDGGAGDDNVDLWSLPTSQPLSFAIGRIPPLQARETCDGCGDGRGTGGSGDDGVDVFGGIADGGSGNDLVQGGKAGDVVLGGSGSDDLHNRTGAGRMRLDGGSAFDTCDLNGATTATVRRCEVVT